MSTMAWGEKAKGELFPSSSFDKGLYRPSLSLSFVTSLVPSFYCVRLLVDSFIRSSSFLLFVRWVAVRTYSLFSSYYGLINIQWVNGETRKLASERRSLACQDRETLSPNLTTYPLACFDQLVVSCLTHSHFYPSFSLSRFGIEVSSFLLSLALTHTHY